MEDVTTLGDLVARTREFVRTEVLEIDKRHDGDPGGEIAVGTTTSASDRTSPQWARAAGLHFAHQNPGVFPTMTVAENMAIGRGFETPAAGSIRWSALVVCL